MNRINITDFQQFLTDTVVRPLKIIYLGIGAGATVFLLVILYLYSRGAPDGAPPGGGHNLLLYSVIHAALIAGGLWSSSFMYTRSFEEKQVRAVTRREGPPGGPLEVGPSDVMTVIRTARILKLALIEGPAFFGLVVCFLGVTGGAIFRQPVYWANLVSYGLLMAAILRDMPTRDKLLYEARSRLGYLFG